MYDIIYSMTSLPPTTYKELLKEFGNPFSIPYERLLWTFDWFDFRDRIVDRDDDKCTKCGRGKYRLLSNEELAEWNAKAQERVNKFHGGNARRI